MGLACPGPSGQVIISRYGGPYNHAISYSAAAGLSASIKLLTGIGLTSIRDHASRLAADLAEQAAGSPYRPLRDRSSSGRIVSLRHPTAVAEGVQARLAEEHRIITRSRGGGIRVSLHAYNCAEDVRAMAQHLNQLAATGGPDGNLPVCSGLRQARSRPGPTVTSPPAADCVGRIDH